jgi:hypothetical protein
MKITEPRIGNFLDISTSHVTQDDMEQLACGTDSVVAYVYEQGAFVVPIDTREEELANYSPEFKGIMLLAKKLGVWFVRFDADGEVYEDLPKMDW